MALFAALALSPGPFFIDFRERPDMGEREQFLSLCEGQRVRTAPPKLVTVGVIAAELGVSVERVSRILRSRPHIRIRAYAGNVRLFDNATIAQVRHEINAVDARRSRENP